MRVFDWFGKSGLPVVSFQDQCNTLLRQGGAPCFSLRWLNGVDDVFLVHYVYEDGSYVGYSREELAHPTGGQRVLRHEHVSMLRLVDANCFIPKNGTDKDQLRARITDLYRHLKYDQRAVVFTEADGTPIWVKGGFNHHDGGFTAEKAYTDPRRPDAVQAVFFTYASVPYYVGEFINGYQIETIPNFVYHSWMGNNVTAPVINAHKEAQRIDLSHRLQKNIEDRRVLDADLADIIRQMNKNHVHE